VQIQAAVDQADFVQDMISLFGDAATGGWLVDRKVQPPPSDRASSLPHRSSAPTPTRISVRRNPARSRSCVLSGLASPTR
jgi:hypothetical protein